MAKRAAPPIRTAHTDDPIASAGLRVSASHASTVEPLHPALVSLVGALARVAAADAWRVAQAAPQTQDPESAP